MPRKKIVVEEVLGVKPEVEVCITPMGRTPNRLELADMAQAMMPAALKKLERVLHEANSDLAVLQAYRALKDTAYGKDPQEISVAMEFENLTDDELKAALYAELGQQPKAE